MRNSRTTSTLPSRRISGADSVTRGNKAFDVHANTYRVDADVVPCFEHRRYLETPQSHWFESGTELLPDNGGKIINWPRQNYDNSFAKNDATLKSLIDGDDLSVRQDHVRRGLLRMQHGCRARERQPQQQEQARPSHMASGRSVCAAPRPIVSDWAISGRSAGSEGWPAP
jgi:hypothetical protein